MRHLLRHLAWLVGIALTISAPAAPRVVVTIKPIHSLVAAVMEGVAEPTLLVKGANSPHAYVLRPSDALALNDASVVFWVGKTLETSFDKPLRALAKDARVIALIDSKRLERLKVRHSGAWETDDHDHTEDEHADFDPHIWLDPRNAMRIVEVVTTELASVDPGNAAVYIRNKDAILTKLAVLDKELNAGLKPVAATPYIVFHDGYQYLEKRYGLNAVGSVAVDPQRSPGARRIRDIREKIERANVRCVFVEPQFSESIVRVIVEGTNAKLGVLDPIGVELKAGPDLYFQLMRDMAKSLATNLAD